ncbi:MAG: TetR/AcrR family transcriptional regulator [Myxococcota bacterium]|nr:TetR/AcrR family transcriptional regulator [Myxococcota bacterium]
MPKRPFLGRLPRPTSKRTARSVARILDAAARIFGREGYQGASMGSVAKEAGVSKGLLHYHFENKEHLLIEAQLAVMREIHRRFLERARAGDRGLPAAIDAIDALWDALQELKAQTPFMVETFSLAAQDGTVRDAFDEFSAEGTALLEEGIRAVMAEEMDRLTLPPDRMAVLIRTMLSGLVVELARARTEEERAQVQLAYEDLRFLFSSFAVGGQP